MSASRYGPITRPAFSGHAPLPMVLTRVCRGFVKFAEKQFTEVVELIQAMEPSARKQGKNKRRAHRTEIRLSVKIKPENGDGNIPWSIAQLRDLSARGVLLATDQEMSQGASFLICLPTKDGLIGKPLICRVAHCKPQNTNSKGGFMIGAEFIGRLDAASAPQNDKSADEQERIQRSILG
jgi:hypothetical protein